MHRYTRYPGPNAQRREQAEGRKLGRVTENCEIAILHLLFNPFLSFALNRLRLRTSGLLLYKPPPYQALRFRILPTVSLLALCLPPPLPIPSLLFPFLLFPSLLLVVFTSLGLAPLDKVYVCMDIGYSGSDRWMAVSLCLSQKKRRLRGVKSP